MAPGCRRHPGAPSLRDVPRARWRGPLSGAAARTPVPVGFEPPTVRPLRLRGRGGGGFGWDSPPPWVFQGGWALPLKTTNPLCPPLAHPQPPPPHLKEAPRNLNKAGTQPPWGGGCARHLQKAWSWPNMVSGYKSGEEIGNGYITPAFSGSPKRGGVKVAAYPWANGPPELRELKSLNSQFIFEPFEYGTSGETNSLTRSPSGRRNFHIAYSRLPPIGAG